ncbi:ATP-binding cassette domain-containing protein [Isoalcanivorax beigongshangi]|uniref:ATP-binding cassette domain-containing protein n=1 Tax=Isoalcanivorax beigongshangi TaxID=3238810 RepID=A0ABV4AFA8_9GAMM
MALASAFPPLLPALRPALPALTAAALGAAAAGLLQLAALWQLTQLIGHGQRSALLWAVALWVASAALGAAASWLAHAAEARCGQRLRQLLAAHLLRLPARTLANLDSKRLRQAVAEDVQALHHLLAHLPAEFATLLVVPLASVVLLVASAGPWALLALLPGVAAAYCYLVSIPRLSAQAGAMQSDVLGDVINAADDYARGIHVQRLYGGEAGAAARFENATRAFAEGMETRVRRVATAAALATALMQAAATFAIVYLIGHQWPPATLAAALLFSLALVTPALRLGHGLDYLHAGRAAAARLAELLREPALPEGQHNSDLGAAVTLHADGFRAGQPLSLTARPGTLTAITGPSGGGKSTLLRALAGQDLLPSGHAHANGVALTELSAEARAALLHLMPQGPQVISRSVRDNLLLAVTHADDATLQWALSEAGLEVALDADASQLSGGEQQRVALARVFLSPAPVLLLDEPTSALDDDTARQIFRRLQGHARDQHRTLVVVTHDAALAAQADTRVALPSPNQGDSYA